MAPQIPKPWMEAKRRFRLSDRHIRMAMRLRLNPTKLGKLSPNRAEPWKRPLPEFIEKLYFRQFRQVEPPREPPAAGQAGPGENTGTRKATVNERPGGVVKRQVAGPDKWLHAKERFNLSPTHLHIALALGLSPKDFRKMADRARSNGLTLAEKLEAMHKAGGNRKPLPDEPFLTTLWRLGNKEWRKRIARRYPSAVPEVKAANEALPPPVPAATMQPLGEADSGSAGTQPGKE